MDIFYPSIERTAIARCYQMIVLKLGIIITSDFLNTYQLNGMNRHDLYSRHVGIEYNYLHSTSIMGEWLFMIDMNSLY